MRYFEGFTGIAGFSLGIEQAYGNLGFQRSEKQRRDVSSETHGRDCSSIESLSERHVAPTCVGFSEIGSVPSAILRYQFSDVRNYGDATGIVWSDVPGFEFFAGGWPCQSFSIAGKRKGFDDTRGTLFFEIARMLSDKRPRHFLLENVAGLLSHDGGKTYATVLRVLAEIKRRSVKVMRIIVGCEFSQIVTAAFRLRGHEAYSCDLLPTEGNPDWHFQEDIFTVLKRERFDLGIFHPPCTYLTVSGNKWFKDQPPRKSGALVGEARRQARQRALGFVWDLMGADIPKIALENPIGILSSNYQKPDQVLQPWMFGHGETKATCLWLKNLPLLQPTDIVTGREQRLHRLSPTKNRAKLRSVTFPGIANAMADQWGNLSDG